VHVTACPTAGANLTGATVTGLPSGVSYQQNGSTLTISGTAPDLSAAQIYTYTVKLINICGTETNGPTGSITVTVPSPGILIGGSFSRNTGSGYYGFPYIASDWTSNGNLEVAASNTNGQQDWSTAMSACPSGWRVPNIRELKFINVSWGSDNAPAGIANFGTLTYWSSTYPNSLQAWYARFSDGEVVSGGTSIPYYYVRCVRTVQPV
jgi:hypothetical protein